ncbi:hypothetical protein [Belnapia moabensis]|uniref:hypothetical protein n=1 Tax=Belnapia moabensis TaxID=365533 RepID=UPI0012EDF74B|nr:hypothetical protein [Belnapia moabensis]
MRDDAHLPRRRLGASALVLAVTKARPARAANALDALLEATALQGGYVAATAAEAARSEELFLRLLRGEYGTALAEAFRPLGFVLETLSLGPETLAVLREAPGAATGKGLYVVRSPGTAPVALQAPHRFHDLDTGTIVARLMAEEVRFAAASWNTTPRRHDDAAGRRVDADLAHAPISHFNAFTRAFGRSRPGGLVAQLHGFEQGRRSSSAGGTAAMIVSAGTASPGPQVRASAACLRAGPEAWQVLLYPEDVRELGGTTNTNAAALRALGGTTEFLHLEMAREPRRRLAREVAPRRHFAACLIGAGR